MIESGDYPEGAEFDLNAPWNQDQNEDDNNNFEPEFEQED